MLPLERDGHDHLLRDQFLSALPGRVVALREGAARLRSRPDSETNRTALVRRLEALHEAALALDLDAVTQALGEALIALEGPAVGLDDLELLDDALSGLSASRPTGPAPSPAAARLELDFDDGHHTLPGLASPFLDLEPEALVTATPPPPPPELNVDASHSEPPPGARSLGRGGAPLVDEAALRGRSVLLVDDDPAVRRRFGEILRRAGAVVEEAKDGVAAWQRCLALAPELVLCDVLMPDLDGFALCRNLKGDVVLGDVPVILLSWKEDLLQRAQELGARADGCLVKDCDDDVILARCAEAMTPRARLEARFGSDELVHGRLDGVTPRFVLDLAARAGRTGVVEFCDAGFAYEAHFAEGVMIGALRRGDHDVQRGKGVLMGMLGVRAGRFILRHSRLGATEFDEPLDRLLEPHVGRIRAACRLVRGKDLQRVAELRLDERVIAPYRATSPTVARKLVDALAAGVAPSRLTASVSAGLLEQVLVDLAVRGAIVAADDAAGGNLLEEPGEGPLDVDVALPELLPEPSVSRREGSDVVFSDRLTAPRDWAEVVLTDAISETPSKGPERSPVSPRVVHPVDAEPARDSEFDLADAILAELAPTPSTPRARLSARLAKSRGSAPPPSPQVDRSKGTAQARTVSDAARATAEPGTPDELVGATAAPVRHAAEPRRECEDDDASDRRVSRSNSAAAEPQEQSASRLLVLAMGRVMQGLEGVRKGTRRLLSRSASWAPPEPSADLSPTPNDVAKVDPVGAAEPETPPGAPVAAASREPREPRTERDAESVPAAVQPVQRAQAPANAPSSAAPEAIEARRAPSAPRAAEGSDRPVAVALELGAAVGGGDPRATRAKLVKADEVEPPPRPEKPRLLLDTAEPEPPDPEQERPELDEDPTDPDFVPPVDERPLRERVLVPSVRRARVLARAALPLLLVSTGSVAAYFLVHTLGSVVPGDAVGVAEESPRAVPPPTPRAVPTLSEKTAAQQLLERGGASTNETPAEIAEEPGTTTELDSQVSALPAGITLAGDKGLLEINSGDKHKIYVGGVFVGRGPARRVPLAPGTHEVKTRLGADERTYQVAVEAGKRTRLEPIARTAVR